MLYLLVECLSCNPLNLLDLIDRFVITFLLRGPIPPAEDGLFLYSQVRLEPIQEFFLAFEASTVEIFYCIYLLSGGSGLVFPTLFSLVTP